MYETPNAKDYTKYTIRKGQRQQYTLFWNASNQANVYGTTEVKDENNRKQGTQRQNTYRTTNTIPVWMLRRKFLRQ